MSKRVVIVGMGAVTPVGLDVASTWESLVAGRSGVDYITHFDASGFETKIAAEVKGFDPIKYIDRKEARRMDRYTHLALACVAQALEQSGLVIDDTNRDDIGVIVGSGIGGIETLSTQFKVLFDRGPGRLSPFLCTMMLSNMAAGHVSIIYGMRGPNYATISACASGTHAIGEAYEIIRRGDAIAMLAGGAEAPVVPIGVGTFNSMRALSTRNDEPSKASRPFDAKRDGFVVGEGAAMLVLEEMEHALQRGAHILAEMVGYGLTGDAYHVTAPPPGGAGAAEAMRRALRQAKLQPEELDYINAHGTSTSLNDKAETEAIKAVLGEHAYRVPISSTKSMTGHLLGAGGAVEAVACVMSILTDTVPPTINYEFPDPDCDLDYVPNVSRRVTVRTALSNSLGFGGHNATIVLKRFD